MDLKKTYIIAEAGVNHNGSYAKAKKLLIAAKDSGADAIKFQTFIPDEVVTKKLSLASYQKTSNTTKQKTMLSMIKKLHLNFHQQKKLYKFGLFRKQKSENLIFILQQAQTANPVVLKIEV